MSRRTVLGNGVFLWLPRVLAIVFILFISMFALDVFGEEQWLLALVMHLIPSFILIIITIIAWRNERVGGWLFLLAGVAMLIHYGITWVALPVFLISALFLFRGYRRSG